MLQCVAVCCSVLQCVAVQDRIKDLYQRAFLSSASEKRHMIGAVCCNVLQCVAVLQCRAVNYSVLQCIAVCCSVL